MNDIRNLHIFKILLFQFDTIEVRVLARRHVNFALLLVREIVTKCITYSDYSV